MTDDEEFSDYGRDPAFSLSFWVGYGIAFLISVGIALLVVWGLDTLYDWQRANAWNTPPQHKEAP